MKLLQILYPGLGGTSTVAFSIIDDLKKKNNSSINNFFIFYGVERLTKNNESKYCLVYNFWITCHVGDF